MLNDKSFDTSSFRKFIPSAWTEFYEDSGQLNATFEAYLRAADIAYTTLAQTDSAKAIDETPLLTSYAEVYQPLAATPTGSAHAHVYMDLDWPAEVDGAFSLDIPGKLVVDPEVFLEGILVPSYLYRLVPMTSLGTRVIFDKRRLDAFITGTPDPAAGSSALGDYALPPSDQITWVSLAFQDIAIIETVDGEVPSTGEPVGADLRIHRIDITKTVDIVADATSATVTTSVNHGRYTYVAELSDGSFVDFSMGVPFPTTLPVSAVYLHANLPLRGWSSDGTLLSFNDTIPGGVSVLITGNGAPYSIQTSGPTKRVSIPFELGGQSRVYVAGVDLTGVGEDGKLSRTPDTGTSLSLAYAVVSPHKHQQVIVPFIAPKMQFLGLIPVASQVFVDGVLRRPTEYTMAGTTLAFNSPVVGSELVVRGPGQLLSSEDPKSAYHVHTKEATYLPAEAAKQYTVATSAFDLDLNPAVFRDGRLYTKWSAPVGGGFVHFDSAIESSVGTHIVVSSSILQRRYANFLPARKDSDYGYTGTIKSIGAVYPTLTGDPEPFTLDGDLLYLDSNYSATWLKDVGVDERLIESRWGADIGLEGESTEDYQRRVTAIRGARFAPSTWESIENYGSIALGSPYTHGPAVSEGGDRVSVKIIDSSGSRNVDLLPFESRVAPTMSGAWALNKLVHKGTDEWLPFFVSDIGEYHPSHILDRQVPMVLEGYATAFEQGALIDINGDFSQVRTGDLVCFSEVTSSPDGETLWLYDNAGITPATADFVGSSVTLTIPLSLPSQAAPLQIPASDGTIWELTATAEGHAVTSLVGPGVITAPVVGDWSIEVDPVTGLLNPQPAAHADTTYWVPGVGGTQWLVKTDSVSGALILEPSSAPYLVKATDSSIWGLTAGPTGSLVAVPATGTPQSSSVRGENGEEYALVVTPLTATTATVSATLITATPATTPPPIYLVGVYDTYELVVSAGVPTLIASSPTSAYDLDRYAVGKYLNIQGAWLSSTSYEITSSVITSSSLVLTVDYQVGPQVSSGVNIYAVNLVTYTQALPTTTNLYAIAGKVEKDRIYIDFEATNQAFGYGEGFYGQGGAGGAIVSSSVGAYKVYTTVPVPRSTTVDWLSAEERARITDILSATLGRLEIIRRDWLETSIGSVDDLGPVIDSLVPAAAFPITYVEAFYGDEIKDEAAVVASDSVETSRSVPSYNVGAPLTGPATAAAAFTTTSAFFAGAGIIGQTHDIPDVDGRYVVIPDIGLSVSSPFSRIFSDTEGAGDELIDAVEGVAYVAGSESRTGFLYSADAAMTIPSLGVSNKFYPNGHTLTYSGASTIDVWFLPAPGAYDLITWGPQVVSIVAGASLDITFAGLSVSLTNELCHLTIKYVGTAVELTAYTATDGAVSSTGTATALTSYTEDIVVRQAALEQFLVFLSDQTLGDIPEKSIVAILPTGIQLLEPDGTGAYANWTARDAAVALLFWDGMSLDYSGHGHTASGGSPTPAPSTLTDRRRRQGDMHAVSPSGLLYVGGTLLNQGQLASTALDISGSSATIGGVTLSSSPIFLYFDNWFWVRLLPALPTSSQPIGIDTTSLLP